MPGVWYLLSVVPAVSLLPARLRTRIHSHLVRQMSTTPVRVSKPAAAPQAVIDLTSPAATPSPVTVARRSARRSTGTGAAAVPLSPFPSPLPAEPEGGFKKKRGRTAAVVSDDDGDDDVVSISPPVATAKRKGQSTTAPTTAAAAATTTPTPAASSSSVAAAAAVAVSKPATKQRAKAAASSDDDDSADTATESDADAADGGAAVSGKPRVHACYLIADSKRTYVGYSVDPSHRLRQHNGLIAGGAKATRRMHGNAELRAVVWPFADKTTALQFEWAWRRKRIKVESIRDRILSSTAAAAAAGGGGGKAPKSAKTAAAKGGGVRASKAGLLVAGYGLVGRIDKLNALLCDPKWTNKAMPTADHPPLTVSWLVDGKVPIDDDGDPPSAAPAAAESKASVTHVSTLLRRYGVAGTAVDSYRYAVGGGVTHESVSSVTTLLARMYPDGFKR